MRIEKTTTVGEIMTRDVKACRANDPMSVAAQIMWDHDCGCVPVIGDDGRVAGILTDRDACMASLFQGRALADMRVKDAASNVVFSVGPKDTLTTAETLMRLKQVRRLPVIDEDAQLVGILSLNDVALHLRVPSHPAPGMTGEAVAATLATISRHRAPAGLSIGLAE